MRINELSANPGDAFSSGVSTGSDAVDTIFNPSKWGKGSATAEPSRKSTAKAKAGLPIESYQKRDAEAIMQAVVNGDVSSLSRQQQELAAVLLRKIQQL